MTLRVFIAVLAVLLVSGSPAAASAQDAVEEPPPIPAGAYGRFTDDQALAFALKAVPGELLSTNARRDGKRYYHQYKILARDKSIYVVEINALNGEVSRIYIDYLSPQAKLPMPVLPLETARMLAADYIKEEKPGLRDPEIRSAVLGVRDQSPVYVIRLAKLAREYTVIMDASDGRILDVDED